MYRIDLTDAEYELLERTYQNVKGRKINWDELETLLLVLLGRARSVEKRNRRDLRKLLINKIRGVLR